MEPNIDRSMWGVIVLIIAVVVGGLAKDKIYDAVSGIFEKHSSAISGLDVSDIGNSGGSPSIEEPTDVNLFIYGTYTAPNGTEYATIERFDLQYILDNYGGVQPDRIVMPSTHNGKQIKRINSGGFSSSSTFKELVLPAYLEEIGTLAFAYTTELQTITMPSTLKRIEEGAFSNSGIKSVKLNDGLEFIGDNAFLYTQLTDVKLPSTIKELGSSVFANTQITKEEYPGKIKEIIVSSTGYTIAKNITEIVINEGVELIGEYIFEQHENVQSVTLPSGTKYHANSFHPNTVVTGGQLIN